MLGKGRACGVSHVLGSTEPRAAQGPRCLYEARALKHRPCVCPAGRSQCPKKRKMQRAAGREDVLGGKEWVPVPLVVLGLEPRASGMLAGRGFQLGLSPSQKKGSKQPQQKDMKNWESPGRTEPCLSAGETQGGCQQGPGLHRSCKTTDGAGRGKTLCRRPH